MKRHATIPITAFFERKTPRRASPALSAAPPHEAVVDLARAAGDTQSSNCNNAGAVADDNDHEHELDDTAATSDERKLLTGVRLRRDGHHVTRLLHARELGCHGGMLQLHPQMPRRRQQQQLIRWLLTHFQPLPLELGLPEHWQREAGFLSDDVFYASCVEFDAQGVLLVAGSSNGIIALFDFDEHFFKSINLAQRTRNAEQSNDHIEVAAGDDSTPTTAATMAPPIEILRPIHTIFTRQEIKRIRWNPSNEDEVACSFSNRNEIHIFNLQQFPTKPHRVLKATSPPSSGYNDIVYMPPSAAHRAPGAGATPRSSLIGGDMSGTIRMWDPKVPARPIWSVSTGTHPVNALALSSNKQWLVCGTEAGFLMTYDVVNLSVPAFSSRAVPQRKASFHLLELIKPFLTSEYAAALLQSSQCSGIMSIRAAPSSPTHVICQLRNDWVVVVDYLHGVVLKLHTFLKPPEPMMPRGRGNVPLSVATAAEHVQATPAPSRMNRSAWLTYHRCASTLLFDDSIVCTGIADNPNLNVIDLRQVPRQASWRDLHQQQQQQQHASQSPETEIAFHRQGRATSKGLKRTKHAIGRLDRFRIPMDGVVTAVSGHPTQNVVVCGGEGMRLRVVAMGSDD